MTDITRRGLLAGAAALAAMPALPAQARTAGAGYVAQVQVLKEARRLVLLDSGKRILKTYPVHLGRRPTGPKRFEGDSRTPEGQYRIAARNPASAFYRSLRLDYPNRIDLAQARRLGKPPGGDIMVHGQPNGVRHTLEGDWTQGCVALANAHMDELWDVVPVGCPILIFP